MNNSERNWSSLQMQDTCGISQMKSYWIIHTHNNILNLITGECVKLPLKSSVAVHIPHLLQLCGYCVNKPWYHEHQEQARFTYTTNTTKDLRL